MDILVLFLMLGRTQIFKRKMPIVSLVGRARAYNVAPNPEQPFLKILLEIRKLVWGCSGYSEIRSSEKELTLWHMDQVIPSGPSPQQCKHNIKPPLFWPTQHPDWSPQIIRGCFYMFPIMGTSQLTGGEWQGDGKPIRKFWHIYDSKRWGKMLEGHKKKWLTSCTSHALKMSWPKYVMTVLVMTQISLKPTVLQFAQQAGLMRLMHMLHSSY